MGKTVVEMKAETQRLKQCTQDLRRIRLRMERLTAEIRSSVEVR